MGRRDVELAFCSCSGREDTPPNSRTTRRAGGSDPDSCIYTVVGNNFS